MRALRVDNFSAEHLYELDELYRSTRDVRIRTRAQMILLTTKQRRGVAEVALIVRESGETVRRRIHRYEAEGVNGSGETASTVAMVPHCREQAVEAPPDLGPPFSGGVGQQPRGSMHEDEALLHRRPERGGAGERPLDQQPQPRADAMPRSTCTRCELPATFSSRPFSRSLAASSGARPSSVIAPRTAAA